ncbi:LacI family DNA-binding transcriptional regulator [uncultured Sphaerochaeta sp.]|uniref:LacI family DNA-binding transcriptional regulator n=1 Tax=uncultured Sphaerochaeta sp. TaxID=886478 RepID=UPI002A0A1DB6|nr:LacI family DNA-binding transcriptional regulator [uncultured Sphaerochaeta sp.]
MTNSTIKEIAQAAKVSIATVSLALNNKKGVSVAKAAEIKQLAYEMGYFKANRNSYVDKTILFVQIVKDHQIMDQNYRIFIADYMEGLSSIASYYYLRIESKIYTKNTMEEILEDLDSLDVFGIVFLGAGLYPEDITILNRCCIPSVFIDVHYAGIHADFIDMDNADCVYQIVSYLESKNYQRVGFVQALERTPNFHYRENAFFEALKESSLECPPSCRYAIAPDSTGVKQFIEQYSKSQEKPQAIFCTNDMIAYQCIQACYDMGIVMPSSLGIVGFDDLPTSSILQPELTTINISKKEIVRIALRKLLDKTDPTNQGITSTILIDGSLVVRRSC